MKDLLNKKAELERSIKTEEDRINIDICTILKDTMPKDTQIGRVYIERDWSEYDYSLFIEVGAKAIQENDFRAIEFGTKITLCFEEEKINFNTGGVGNILIGKDKPQQLKFQILNVLATKYEELENSFKNIEKSTWIKLSKEHAEVSGTIFNLEKEERELERLHEVETAEALLTTGNTLQVNFGRIQGLRRVLKTTSKMITFESLYGDTWKENETTKKEKVLFSILAGKTTEVK